MNAWPTTGEIREQFRASDRPAFDRWLAQHDREVARKAWDEGFLSHAELDTQGHLSHNVGIPGLPMVNPYKEEA